MRHAIVIIAALLRRLPEKASQEGYEQPGRLTLFILIDAFSNRRYVKPVCHAINIPPIKIPPIKFCNLSAGRKQQLFANIERRLMYMNVLNTLPDTPQDSLILKSKPGRAFYDVTEQ